MSSDRYRLSFDAVADVYERTRPTYAPEALAFVEQRLPLGRVLDLGAGTGKLTRQLVALGADVVAVEPGDAMRAMLEQVMLDVMYAVPDEPPRKAFRITRAFVRKQIAAAEAEDVPLRQSA